MEESANLNEWYKIFRYFKKTIDGKLPHLTSLDLGRTFIKYSTKIFSSNFINHCSICSKFSPLENYFYEIGARICSQCLKCNLCEKKFEKSIYKEIFMKMEDNRIKLFCQVDCDKNCVKLTFQILPFFWETTFKKVENIAILNKNHYYGETFCLDIS